MRAMKRRPAKARPDPAPSRLAYRVQRLLLTPLFHKMVRVGLPLVALGALLGWVASQPELRAELQARALDMQAYVEQRPEFTVHMLAVEGASPELVEDVREVLPVTFPISSFDLDLEALKDVISELDAVADVTLRVQAGGVLDVSIAERIPALVWQTRAALVLLDAEGHRVGPIEARAAHAKLPLVVGPGADRAAAEALQLLRIARPVAPRLIGLQRIGERRWDVVLTENQRIMLPEESPIPALERAMAVDAAQELLARDVVALDMRLPDRPTLRLRPAAVDALWSIRQVDLNRDEQ
ncbi:cell division protein FtsQ/DivIB [Tropicimonas sp. S265A]|uniref:cell division protein FtsQ/DivIB n=1 Tax=Tropicimonas sp. S265A TaxID=3415134 RepID=UPI003C7C17E4